MSLIETIHPKLIDEAMTKKGLQYWLKALSTSTHAIIEDRCCTSVVETDAWWRVVLVMVHDDVPKGLDQICVNGKQCLIGGSSSRSGTTNTTAAGGCEHFL